MFCVIHLHIFPTLSYGYTPDMFSLGGIAAKTGATEDSLSEEEDIHLQAADQGWMLYV